jgi:hypothetical protein
MASHGLIHDLLDYFLGGRGHAADLWLGGQHDATQEQLLNAMVHNDIDFRASSPEEARLYLQGMGATLNSLGSIPGGLADHLPGGAASEAEMRFLRTGEL